MIEVRTGSGTYVRAPVPGGAFRLPWVKQDDAGPGVREQFQARKLIEPELAALAGGDDPRRRDRRAGRGHRSGRGAVRRGPAGGSRRLLLPRPSRRVLAQHRSGGPRPSFVGPAQPRDVADDPHPHRAAGASQAGRGRPARDRRGFASPRCSRLRAPPCGVTSRRPSDAISASSAQLREPSPTSGGTANRRKHEDK